MGGTRRRRVEPTDEWEQLKLLCRWPEQLAYEEIRPTVLFGSSYWNSEPRPPVNFGEGSKSLPRSLNRAGVTRADKDSAPSGVHAGSSIDRRRVAFEAA